MNTPSSNESWWSSWTKGLLGETKPQQGNCPPCRCPGDEMMASEESTGYYGGKKKRRTRRRRHRMRGGALSPVAQYAAPISGIASAQYKTVGGSRKRRHRKRRTSRR